MSEPGSAPPDRGGGIRIARIFGVPVYVAPSWFVVAAVITLTFAPSVEARVPGLGPLAYVVALAFTLLLYASVLLHELSHSVVALRFGLPVRRMTLYLLGGVSEIGREPETPGREAAVAVVGPIVSLLTAVAAYGVSRLLDPGTVPRLLALETTFANVAVGVFNLLPGLPLDGGRVLLAGVWRVSGRRLTGTVVAAYAGRLLAVLLLVVPILLALAAGTRPSFVTVAWAGLLAAFMWTSAGQALAAARVRDKLPRVAARRLRRPVLGVPAALPLGEALRRAQAAGARGLVVVDDDGSPTGLVSEAAVVAVPDQRRPWVDVASVSRRLEPGLVLRVDLAGEELIRAMQGAPGTEYLLVEADGSLAGMLATSDVERAL